MPTYETKAINIGGRRQQLGVMRRAGHGVPILFLHGFGSTKEDYADFDCHREFDGRTGLAFDLPGCGASPWHAPDTDVIECYRDVSLGLLDVYGIDKAHVVGHSMGGLTGLLLAASHPQRVASVTSIEGNLAEEDCFLSRRIFEHPSNEDRLFLERLSSWLQSQSTYSYGLYAATLPLKVRWKAVRPIFKSIVAWSDGHDLLKTFLDLQIPRMFMYGASNRALSYLPALRNSNVRLTEIAYSGHFPMYSNPVAMWQALADFLTVQAD